MMDDLINRQAAIDAILSEPPDAHYPIWYAERIEKLPSAEPERLTDDDFETIRIHLNAIKEKLCNQRRWEEAEEYQRIIDRFMAFASAEPRKKGKWIEYTDCEGKSRRITCDQCGHEEWNWRNPNFCPNCGSEMVQD